MLIDQRSQPKASSVSSLLTSNSDGASEAVGRPMMHRANAGFRTLKIAQVTVSSSRGSAESVSGDLLCERLQAVCRQLAEQQIMVENICRLPALVDQWISGDRVQCVLVRGGTGLTVHDCAPGAIQPFLDREPPGFDERFRHHSLQEIGSSMVQSRAFAGVANSTRVFALPGSASACRTAGDDILQPQPDRYRYTRPCNFVALVS